MKKLAMITGLVLWAGAMFGFPFNDEIGTVNNLQAWADCGTPTNNYAENFSMWFGGNWHLQGVLHPQTYTGCYTEIINGTVSDLNAVGTYDLTNFYWPIPALSVCNGTTHFPAIIYFGLKSLKQFSEVEARTLYLTIGPDGSVHGSAEIY